MMFVFDVGQLKKRINSLEILIEPVEIDQYLRR